MSDLSTEQRAALFKKYEQAMLPRAEDRGEIGYRVVNPDQMDEPLLLAALDPETQARFESFMDTLRD